MKRISFLVWLCVGSELLAQRAGFESGDGKTSIFLRESGALNFNVADTSIRFGYLRRQSANAQGNPSHVMYGFEVFGKPSNGVADFFSKGKPANEGGASVSLGRHGLRARDIDTQTGKETIKDDWIVLQAGYRRSTFHNFPVTGVAPNSRKRNFDGYAATVSYNARMALGSGSTKGQGTGVLVGIGGGIERRNNLDDLVPVTIDTQVTSAVTASQVTTVRQTRSGYLGDYAEYMAAPIYTDLIFLPLRFKSRIAVDIFTRSSLAKNRGSFSPGVGVFYTKEGAPTKVIGGISAAYKDGHLRLGLVAGLNF